MSDNEATTDKAAAELAGRLEPLVRCEPNYRRISESVAEEIIHAMHYWDHYDKIDLSTASADDILRCTEGGIERYRNDPIFRAKVMSLTSAISLAVRKELQASND